MKTSARLPSRNRIKSVFLASTMVLLWLAGCGGGGGGDAWLYPLWVETDVVVADIDADGRADVLTLAQLANSLTDRKGILLVHRQTSPGVFAAPQSYVVGTYPWRMALADVDGDSAPDLVVTDVGDTLAGAAHNGVVWLLRQETANRGRFLAPQQLAANTNYPSDVAIGDMNGDSVPDIVVTGTYAPDKGAGLLIQDAGQRGTFLASTLIPLPGNATTLAMGDLNGDGRNDLVFRIYLASINYVPSTNLGIVYQQDGGTLATVESLSPQTGLNGQNLSIAHYDSDALADIVEFMTPADAAYHAKVTTLLQAPAGVYTASDTSLTGVLGLRDAVFADLNGDGRPDFASIGSYPVGTPSKIYCTLNLFMQNGSGGYNPPISLSMPILANALGVGDVNGDGLNDLVAYGGAEQVVQVLQSATQPGTFMTPQSLR